MLVALTGGIGSGKSLAAKFFKELGIDVLYADDIAKEIMISNPSVRKSLIEKFGSDVYGKDNKLNKDLLRREIFSNETKRFWLNNLVHPHVWEHINKASGITKNKYIIAEIPLIFESKSHDKVDKVIVVDCPIEQQIQRACARDSRSRKQIEKIIGTQITREKRLEMANYVLDNSSSADSLKNQVLKVHKELCK